MIRICLFCLLFIAVEPSPALAAREAPITYSRTTIVVMRDQGKTTVGEPIAEKPGIVFDAEVRDAASYYRQSGWFNLAPPSEKMAFMLTFSQPSIAPIQRSEQHVPLDVLMVDHEGVIVQIIPHLMLAALEQDIVAQQPITAFVFLRGGICDVLEIKPGHRIVHKNFKRPPTVLTISDQPETKIQPVMTPQIKPVPPAASDIPAVAPSTLPKSQASPKASVPRRNAPSALMVPVN